MSAVPRDGIRALTDRLDSDSSGTSKWNVGCCIYELTVTKSRQSLTVMPYTACAGSRADRVVVRRTMELTGSGVLACMNELLNGRVGVQCSKAQCSAHDSVVSTLVQIDGCADGGGVRLVGE